MEAPSIDIQHLYKRYRGSDYFAVQDLSLTISPGDFFGLLGPNGAGKTTLISMLCGLIKPTSGVFTLAGCNYAKHAKIIKQQIGVVPQEYALYPTLTARENLTYFGSMYGLKRGRLKEQVDSNLARMDLLKFADQRVETFSGGMKRRLNLIVGVLHDPRILFLDEPTVGVDVHSRKEITRFLQQLNSVGTTIVYTSHDLPEAEVLCSRIAILEDGQIIKEGTCAGLISSIDQADGLEDVFIGVTRKKLRGDV